MARKLLLLSFTLVACLLGSLGAEAAEAYANYTPENTTLTFYYDNLRSSRTGTTYDLNTGTQSPGWIRDNTNVHVTQAVFDPSFANARPTTTLYWFYEMTHLQSISGISYLNTSNTTIMSGMFFDCIGLKELDVSHFNTANVTNMKYMFYACQQLTSIDVSHFNTANVTDMSNMFDGCNALSSLDLSSFNTANVTDMSYMFYYCIGLTSLDLSSFNTANVTNMEWMFASSNLSTIYVGDGWSTDAVTSSTEMFGYCNYLTGGMGTAFDYSHTNKAYAHIDGGPSNPGYFTDPSAVAEAYAVYTQNNTTLTFYYDNLRDIRPGTTYDLNTGNNYPAWFYNLYNVIEDIIPVTRVVFYSSFAGARPTSTFNWFNSMSNLTTIQGIGFLNTEEVTTMNGMFMYCTGLKRLNLSSFNTGNVTNMSNMFYGCSGLTSLDLSGFNTAKVTKMDDMFYECSGLSSLDLSSFNTAKVQSAYSVFRGCSNLTTIYVSNGWSTAAIEYSTNMFTGCTSLVGGNGTTYDANHTDAEYARIDRGPNNPGYFTGKFDYIPGDVDGDGQVKIADVTALINYLLSGDASAINLQAADVNGDGQVKIADVTSLINYLLSGNW